MANTGLIRFVAFVFGVLALLFLIIATPTHNWYVGYLEASNSTNGSTEDRTGDIYGGIFEDCYVRNDDSYTCRTQEAGGKSKLFQNHLKIINEQFLHPPSSRLVIGSLFVNTTYLQPSYEPGPKGASTKNFCQLLSADWYSIHFDILSVQSSSGGLCGGFFFD